MDDGLTLFSGFYALLFRCMMLMLLGMTQGGITSEYEAVLDAWLRDPLVSRIKVKQRYYVLLTLCVARATAMPCSSSSLLLSGGDLAAYHSPAGIITLSLACTLWTS